jgi:acyl carrier protein
MDSKEIKAQVKSYILDQFLPGESPEALTDDTELITSRILDSLATLKLVSHLEKTFRITIEPHEADVEYLNTIDQIEALVSRKKR